MNIYQHILRHSKMITLIRTINTIESSYEESYNRNMNMLSFIKKLIDNYDGSVEMKNNSLFCHITIKSLFSLIYSIFSIVNLLNANLFIFSM